ncbi:hypothetical protein ACHAXT_013154 [Thalassiosira profunda]
MGGELEMSAAQRQARRLNELQDEEESSLLRNGNETPRAAASLDRLAGGGPSLSRDFAICNTAWNRLSCPTRSALLLVVGALLMLATYEFAVNEGVREQERDNSKQTADEGAWKSWRVFADGGGSGAAKPKDKGAVNEGAKAPKEQKDEDVIQRPEVHRVFNKQTLQNTRAAAKELIAMLHEYYGGEKKAGAMLAKSWQAQWPLYGDFVLTDDGDLGVVDEDSTTDRRRRMGRNKAGKDNDKKELTEEEKAEKARKDERKEARKKRKKEAKALNDPDAMSKEEQKQYQQYKRQRATKLVETMARAILDPSRDRFIIGTIGSSVAAGHDNCHYDAYESQLERTLTPVFAAANMHAIVENAGEGGGCGDNHQNQVFCITHNVSPDVDIIHYSWTYFEKEQPEIQREQLVRWAQRMERRPLVHHLVARGKKNTCSGDVKANVDLETTYATYGYNAFCIQTGLYAGGHDYDAENEQGVNRFGWQHTGDGYHNTTRYGEELPDDDPRKASLGVVYRNWHPGPLGFQVAADAFAYVYTTGLMVALDIIEKDLNAGVDPLKRWFQTERRLTVANPSKYLIERELLKLPPLGDMPEPLFCDPLYCSTDPPSCLNYEKPTFGTPGITVQTQSKWEIWQEPNKWVHFLLTIAFDIVYTF